MSTSIYTLILIPVDFDWRVLLPVIALALLILPVLGFALRREVAGVDPCEVLRDPGGL